MDGLRTIIAFLLLSTTPTPAPAGENLLRTFATCAGRFSAQMEHEWLLSDPAADRTGIERRNMIALLQTIAAPAALPTALNIRVEAKHAHAVLLTRASFGSDRRDAAWAAHRAEANIAACRALLLS